MRGLAELRRRDALKLLASSALFPLAGCSPPQQEILPYVDMPEGLVAGEPQYYATALPLAGFARGVIVEAIDGRPIKIAGNPRHPASLGSTDIFAEAEILSLYDPDRSRAVRGRQPVATWNSFFAALQARLDALMARDGEGMRLVTGRITSPTLTRQIAALMRRYPAARRHAYEPAEGDLAEVPERRRVRLAEADVIVTLDADPLGPGPDQIVNGRGFAAGRKPGSDRPVSRLYAIESAHTLTGANADHRLALAPADIEALAATLAARLTSRNVLRFGLPGKALRFADSIAKDIERAGNRAVLLAGDALSPAAHDQIDAANEAIGAPVEKAAGPKTAPGLASLSDLWAALETGDVTDLFIVGCNPCHDFPDPALLQAIDEVEFTAHAGTHENETALACRWHLPLPHPLETWSDLAATDGTMSIVQPLIRPLYATRSLHEILAFMLGDPETSSHDIVRETWRQGRADDEFEAWWRDTLVRGVVESAPPPAAMPAKAASPQTAAPPRSTPEGSFVALIRADSSIYDGTYCGNAWLQECPKPIGKHTWSNVVSLSPNDAEGLEVEDGDVVMVRSAEGEIAGPVHVDSGQADGVVGLTLGYGRSAAGAIGTGLGYNPRRLALRWLAAKIDGVAVIPTGEHDPAPSTQGSFRLEGAFEKLLPQVSGATGYELRRQHPTEPGQSFLHPERPDDDYRWAMVIDTAACIGCNACVIACQSENNIPVVGPEEVANNRIMHWLRIDRYELGEPQAPCTGFEPVPCMHCEKAPCEPVCPVEASVHDVEGLNNQVYNRCVGTRFCQSNCPYKVRRFNWFAYASGQQYANLGEDPMRALMNPDVTVRTRGVMEKCTYCVQRISRARRNAKAYDVPIGEGDVVTACQQACPTEAIRFGNLEDEHSAVSRQRRDKRHFTLLEELGTSPRTTYLARIRNANPELEGGDS